MIYFRYTTPTKHQLLVMHAAAIVQRENSSHIGIFCSKTLKLLEAL